MTTEEVINKCPSLFVSQKDTLKEGVNLSKISLRIVEDLLNLGWDVSEIICTPVRKNSKVQSYVLSFTMPGFTLSFEKNGDSLIPELIMVGSNTSKLFRFYFCYHRLASQTRFYLPLVTSGELKKKSFFINFDLGKYSPEEIKEFLEGYLLKVQANYKYVDELLKVNLSSELRIAYASICFLRKKAPFLKIDLKRIHSVPEITASILLVPLRKVDVRSNAWNIYHTVLEKVVRGFKGASRKEQKRLYMYQPIGDHEKVILTSIQAYLDLQKLIKHETKAH